MILLSVFLAMSVLEPIWAKERLQQPLHRKVSRGLLQKAEAEGYNCTARSRSPRGRSGGVKSFLKSWATGELTAVGLARFASGIDTEDKTDAGIGMGRLAGIASMTSSSDKNCSSKSIDLLSQTGLDTLVRPVPHAKKEKTITYHLRPTDLMRLIHSRNRRKFGKIFGANKADFRSLSLKYSSSAADSLA